MRFVFLTIDGNHAVALRQAAERLRAEHRIDLQVACYDAASLRDEAGWRKLERDLSAADMVFGARLFGEEYVRPLERLLSVLKCPVLVITSNPALMHQTRIGKFSLASRDDDGDSGMFGQWVKKLRSNGGAGEARRQLAILRNLSKVLKIIPGKARDLYVYIVSHQYWTNSSPENLYRLICLFIDHYVPKYKGKVPVLDPVTYPEMALFHPAAPEPFETTDVYQKWYRGYVGKAAKADKKRGQAQATESKGSVGILALRTVALGGNIAHLTALVEALERRGVEPRMAYASGLDMRPAIDAFFRPKGGAGALLDALRHGGARETSTVDLLVNASGFALVGGPAESRPADGRAALASLDVGYLGPVPLAFQRVEDWREDDGGLAPVQSALSIAVPELDGAAEPLIYGGPSLKGDAFVPLTAEVEQLADRITRRVILRNKANAEKKLALVIFSFPPNLGNVGTAAYLDVFASLFAMLQALKADGYTVNVPADVDELRRMVVEGDSLIYGTDANVAARMPVNDYRKLFPSEAAIEPYWGRAPGELLNDGQNFLILGRQFGNVFVGIQPSFGYERDPMRLLMAKDAAPNHAFAAFYTWLRHVYRADAVVHVGTHGALEFMPGKQVGMSSDCWPMRLIGDLPNFYYYSVNNPSEAAIAKRRSAATLVSYLVPPLQQAGLYKGLRQLKDTIDQYRNRPDEHLLETIREQAVKLGMGAVNEAADAQPDADPLTYIANLSHELLQIEQRMIPAGLHVIGRAPQAIELVDFLNLAASFRPLKARGQQEHTLPQLIAAGLGYDYAALRDSLGSDLEAQARWQEIEKISKESVRQFVEAEIAKKPRGKDTAAKLHAIDVAAGHQAERYLTQAAKIAPSSLGDLWTFLGELLHNLLATGEITSLLHALRGGFVPPSPSNDVVRDPSVVPTGRNVFSLDPYRVPSQAAMERGQILVHELLGRTISEQGRLPESVAVVLWGSDNLKSGCEGVAQVLALMGAEPQLDELGNVSDVRLIPLAKLGRPRIDVVVTVSGIFRDLLGNQMQLIDKAAQMAALADEPVEKNYLRAHAMEQAAELGVSLEEAAQRVFANAPGSYGANVNHLVDSGTWDDQTQLSDAFLSRKSFTIGKNGQWRESRAIMEKALSTVDLSFQNIDSFEVGISDIDNYYESLGGMTKSIETLSGKRPSVLVADAMGSAGRVSSLEQMVRLETRSKLLNPKWYEAMLAHGYEGAREIEARVNNTYGWSATAGAVDSWVYQEVAETFMLDEKMRERLASMNSHAAAGMVRRLLEANGRGFWDADEATLERLRTIYADLEDRLEGVSIGS